MTLFFHELKRDRVRLIVWTAAIAFMLMISIIIYPQMTSQMDEMGQMFSEMGGFSEAFNMDKVNFGEFRGYFAVECGNVLGLGEWLLVVIDASGFTLNHLGCCPTRPFRQVYGAPTSLSPSNNVNCSS